MGYNSTADGLLLILVVIVMFALSVGLRHIGRKP